MRIIFMSLTAHMDFSLLYGKVPRIHFNFWLKKLILDRILPLNLFHLNFFFQPRTYSSSIVVEKSQNSY